MLVLNGKKVAQHWMDQISAEVAKMPQKPGLGVVLVGDDPASQVYVKNKFKACEVVGMKSFERRLPAEASEASVRAAVKEMNQNPEVTAYLVQLPLPKHLNSDRVMSWIDPAKDADGLTSASLGWMFVGQPKALPCTPHGVMKILEHYKISLAGKDAVVIGRSQIVGLPMAHLLTRGNATVTVCHSQTQDLLKHTQRADLVVVAAGRPEFLNKDAFKKGAVIVDVGIHRKALGGLTGDVNPQGIETVASAFTPVPGGVGPMTIGMLLYNTLQLARPSK